MNVLVIGAGAVGSLYGSLLARAGHAVSILARSDYDHVKTHGVDFYGDSPLGAWRFTPHRVVNNASDLPEKPDCVLLCVKHVPGLNRVSLLNEVVGPNTVIVLIANGIDIEGELAEAFPSNELISGLAFVCVTRTAPGRIWLQSHDALTLGPYPSGTSKTVEALCADFVASGIACKPSPDIVTSRWLKCVWNAPFNPLSVVSGGLTVDKILADQENFVRALMTEVCAVAAATGHPLPVDCIEKIIHLTRELKPYKTSMLLDFEAGRPMETEVILGATVRAGRKAGVAIPHLESLYAVMKLIERKEAS